MIKVFNSIRFFTTLSKYLGYTSLSIMVLFLTLASIYRTFGSPILGDVEISSLLMVVLIFFALPFTQVSDAHIKIGLIVDRLPQKFQLFLDILSSILTFFVAIIIAVVFYQTSMILLIENPEFSELLNIPLSPLMVIIFISFAIWALESVLKLMEDIKKIINSKEVIQEQVSQEQVVGEVE
ncbi:TRAP transporter small permease [Neobacillus niacini]|uniref:TRAP transporter small permease n=1 Tax=Neobacillus niacini TaxID=86668 RepID=UPI002FFFF339